MELIKPGKVSDSPLELVDLPVPDPRPDQLRIKVRACGVCHTDLHTVEGELDLPKLPIVPGHEVIGSVDEVGADTSRFERGDRVGVAWLNSSCGKCRYCQRGMENLCQRARFTGLHADKGYEEYMVVGSDYAYPIPEKVSDENAAPLMCAGVIGYRSLRLSEIRPGGKLGLFGFGASAHIVIQLANSMDCEVYVFTRSEEHRELARQLGSVWEGSATDDPPEKLDSAITFAPAGWVAAEALKKLDRGGTLAINAIHMSPLPEIGYQDLWWERTIRSVANVTREDAMEFLKMAKDIGIRTEVETFNLEDANEVLTMLKASEIEGAAVLSI
jgi:propanol-preferring alcohol dehydrogenase